MEFTHHPLTPKIGAEIVGLDLRTPLDDATMARLRQIWVDHVILLFTDQDLDDDQQIAFSRRIGDLEITSISAVHLDGRPEIYPATNLDATDELLPSDHPLMLITRANEKWHSDSSFRRVPAMASLLHARIVPPVGGETGFVNMIAAYESLDDAMKERIEGLVGVHNFFWSTPEWGHISEQERAAIPPVRHPVARVHPETGRKAIYVGSHTETIEGMQFDEARELIDALVAHASQPEFVYQHQWRVGDLVLWDNRAALHRGMGFDHINYKRRMHRTTVAGTGPTLPDADRAGVS